ncbi:hypothetical protein [endosymbiont GvMRE of Glomus versiforme]|uniref:hypothetical protein n=1 Tax=endosymbiont GvMRE of Glomus versiforme TaxID=2039283 RepID=UPI000ECF4051|nr:hypothetical protein [endosymbiont GvMRE of Glomus versiforme]RHZ36401.1 hypothetical protein GvMRE_Ic1g199 [endosymbiont GvMRE of Glomus versiforme]RHZ37641.1 hypothetical protein GvMRE_I1g510 [endosymbiont GvMRE of Glomus versiforme]
MNEIINKELVLLTIESNNEQVGQLFIATNKAKNLKEQKRLLSLALTLSSYFQKLTSQEINADLSLIIKTIRKINCVSPVSFMPALTPKENLKEHKQKFMLLFSEVSAERLTELQEIERNAYLRKCCKSCQKDFQTIREKASQEATDRFFFCPNTKCINFGLEKGEGK